LAKTGVEQVLFPETGIGFDELAEMLLGKNREYIDEYGFGTIKPYRHNMILEQGQLGAPYTGKLNLPMHIYVAKESNMHKPTDPEDILIGTDFNQGVHGIGPRKSLKMIKEHETIEGALKTLDVDDKPTSEEISSIRKIFLEPDVTDSYDLLWSDVDENEVLRILCDRHQFSTSRVSDTLGKYEQTRKGTTQKTLF
jgi:hypothetical protein